MAMESSSSGSKDEAMQVRSIYSTILEAQPSCVEWSTTWPDICVIGTYNLVESVDLQHGSHARTGGIMIFRWDGRILYAFAHYEVCIGKAWVRYLTDMLTH